MNGTLSIYFPCEIKNTSELRRLNKRWKRNRSRQIRRIHNAQRPLTDLMDLDLCFQENKYILKSFHNKIRSKISPYLSAPYATPCIEWEYTKSRESRILSKEVSVVLSRFQLEYPKIKGATIEGALLFHINVDNRIATFVVVLNFKGLEVDDIIHLKHIFYKRTTVHITDYCVGHVNYTCSSSCNCEERPFNCLKGCLSKSVWSGTIQEYVVSYNPMLQKELKNEIDFRARYSCLEIVNIPSIYLDAKRKYYGLLTADECYLLTKRTVVNETLKRDYSANDAYRLYMKGYNLLILTNQESYKGLVTRKNTFFEHVIVGTDYIEPHRFFSHSCIAGVGKKLFPSLLKTVELHYLINKITSHDIEIQKRSTVNPFVFIRRAKKLWDIIYDIDVNGIHMNNDILKSFGLLEQKEEIRQEYHAILSLSLSYAASIAAVLTFILTIIQICK